MSNARGPPTLIGNVQIPLLETGNGKLGTSNETNLESREPRAAPTAQPPSANHILRTSNINLRPSTSQPSNLPTRARRRLAPSTRSLPRASRLFFVCPSLGSLARLVRHYLRPLSSASIRYSSDYRGLKPSTLTAILLSQTLRNSSARATRYLPLRIPSAANTCTTLDVFCPRPLHDPLAQPLKTRWSR